MRVIEELLKFVFLFYVLKFSSSAQNIRRGNSSTSTIDNTEFFLIWIDDNVRECTDDCRLTQSLLQQHVPTAHFEWDIDDAINRISAAKGTDKLIFIVAAGRKASLLFQYLTYYNLDDDISALFIFCSNINHYQQLKHDKLIGIFDDRQILSESIRATKFILIAKKVKVSAHLFDQEQIWSREVSSVTLTHIWHRLVLEVLAALPRDESAKLEMIKKSQEYYADQYKELQNIELFQTSYTFDKAIEWHTADSFVHKLVNKALRTENIDLLYAFRFFIGELKVAIEQEFISQEQSRGTIATKIKMGLNTVIKLYSGQNLPEREVDKLKLRVGEIISVNSFFSTSLSASEATDFAKRGVRSYNMQRVLVEIGLNTSTPDMVSFVEMQHRARYRDEEEVLFDCNALFNITDVQYNQYSEMWLVKMTVMSKTSVDKHPYLEMLRETIIQNHSAAVAFGIILAQGFDRKEQALNYFDQILLTYPSTHQDIPDVLHQRGIVYEAKGDHASALRDYEKALEIHRQRVRENFLGMASITSNIGMLQSMQSDYTVSLASHQEALNLYDTVYGMETDHFSKAKANENIGLVYHKNGSDLIANEYFMRAWAIYSRILPEKHPSLIELLGHMGAVHEAVNNFDLAMEYFRRQLDWTENVLPPDHPLLITCLDSVSRIHTRFNQSSNIYDLIGEYLENLLKMLGDRHPAIPRLLMMFASLYESTQPTKAIELYEQSLSIGEDLGKMNGDMVFTCHRSLVQLYRKTKNMNDALIHALQALSYRQRILSAKQDRSLEADELYNVGSILLEMNQSTDALRFLTKSLSMYRSTGSHDHPNVQAILTSIIQAVKQNESDKE